MILHLERKFTSLTETFIVNQINAVRNFDSTVFTVSYLNALEAEAEIYYPKNKAFLETKFLRGSHKKYFSKQYEKLRPELVHSHFLRDAAFFHPFTKKLKIPKVCSAYGYDVSSFPKEHKWYANRIYPKIFEEYDMFLAMSDDMRDDLAALGCPKNKIKVHYHGIATSKFDIKRTVKSTIDTKLELLTISSIEAKKGHLDVLEALSILLKSNSKLNISYTIVGSGSMDHILLEFVSQHNLTDVVNFKPAIKHGKGFNEYLAKADVFVHPSLKTKTGDKEGIPGAIVEAMSSGLPVITTFHAGIPSIIETGETGFLVNEKDPQGIARFIKSIYQDRELGKRVGRNAKQYAQKNLDLNEKAIDLEVIYSDLIREKNRH